MECGHILIRKKICRTNYFWFTLFLSYSYRGHDYRFTNYVYFILLLGIQYSTPFLVIKKARKREI